MSRSSRPRSVVVVVVAMLMAAGALMGAQVSAQTTPKLDPAKLGMYVGFDRGDRFTQFERELGIPIRYVVTMADSRSPSAMMSSVWGQFAKREAYLPKVANRVEVILSMPLAFGPGGMGMTQAGQSTIRQNLLATAAGRLDGEFRTAARYLKEAGYGDAIIRLGHEFDGDWAPYSARNNNAAYIAAFRHVHDVFKSESSAFRFEWTAMDAHFIQYGPPAYPGNDYVDIVGLDMYWRESAPITDAQWNNQMKNVLIAHKAFAVSKGKPVSYPEWGRSLADHSRFIDLMHGWFSSLPATGPGGLVYHSSFNEPGNVGSYDPYNLDLLPKVKRRYIELFGRQSAPLAPTPTPAPAPAPTYSPAERLPSGQSLPAAPTTAAPPSTAPLATKGASATNVSSVAGTATTASITARIDNGTLVASWSHPAALNYIMRYKPTDSPWWIWRSQSLATSASISGVDPSKDYTVEVITNIGGTWREWNPLLVKRSGAASTPGVPAPTTPTTSTTTSTTTPTVVQAPNTTSGTARSASVAGNDTQASISARVDNGKLVASWSHPTAMNYIMRYKSITSPWWIWGPQSLSATRTVSVDPVAGYVVEVITNVLGKWQEWQRLTIPSGD
jgi:hypothetical protein